MPGICAAIVITSDGNGYGVKLRYDDNNYVDITSGQMKQLVPTTRLPMVANILR